MIGELVAAAVVDKRVWDVQQGDSPDGAYLVGQPGPVLPFVIFRAYKVPVGFVTEEIRFIGPSGRTIFTWGPRTQRMIGAMDLSTFVDVVEDCVFDESGPYLITFIVDGEVMGQVEVPFFVQEAPAKLPKETEDGLKKSDVIWVGADIKGKRWSIPAWFAYKNGKIYLLSQKKMGDDEQTVPGVPTADQLIVTTRRKGRETSLGEFRAAQRLLEGQEWEDAAKILADRRRSRVGSPQERIDRWRETCDIVELVPSIPA